jgi:HTH-type transcriptional regulator / antitoxin HigA
MIAPKNIDTKRYGRLLARALPLVIETDEERRRAHQIVESLMARKDRRTPEETELLRLVASLIQAYESRGRKEPTSKPHELLRFLLEENGLKQRDLLEIFGAKSIVSEVINGKRAITKAQALKLAARFSVRPEIFIDWT